MVTVWRDFAPDMWYKICNRKGGTCMGVDGNSDASGMRVEGGSWKSHFYQSWELTNVGGSYNIQAQNSKLWLDVRGYSPSSGAVIQQHDYTGNSNQRWVVKTLGDGWYNIISGNTAGTSAPMCLTLDQGSSAESTAIYQAPCSTGSEKQWSITLTQL